MRCMGITSILRDMDVLTKSTLVGLRPVHFREYAYGLSKLFNIVTRTMAISGQKDAQQLGNHQTYGQRFKHAIIHPRLPDHP